MNNHGKNGQNPNLWIKCAGTEKKEMLTMFRILSDSTFPSILPSKSRRKPVHTCKYNHINADVNSVLYVHTAKHTLREHEHMTHPQDVRKWDFLPSLTLSRPFTAGSWPVSPFLPCILGLYSPIISLPKSSCSSWGNNRAFSHFCLDLMIEIWFLHPGFSESLDLCPQKPPHSGFSSGMLLDYARW